MDEEREDPDTSYDRMREEAAREAQYIEFEREDAEYDELGIERPYETPADDGEDIPF